MPKRQHRGSTLDSFLEQEGTLGKFQAQAIKEVIEWQLAGELRSKSALLVDKSSYGQDTV